MFRFFLKLGGHETKQSLSFLPKTYFQTKLISWTHSSWIWSHRAFKWEFWFFARRLCLHLPEHFNTSVPSLLHLSSHFRWMCWTVDSPAFDGFSSRALKTCRELYFEVLYSVVQVIVEFFAESTRCVVYHVYMLLCHWDF